jgi:hypothetical protein
MNKNTSALKKNLPYLIIVVLFFGLIFMGYELLKPKDTVNNKTASNQNGQSFGGNGNGGDFGGGGSGGSGRRGNFTPPTAGTISNISGETITMTDTSDNSTKTITCDSTTRFSEFSNGQRSQLSISDLTNGETINVMGTANGNNITAKMIFVGTMPTRGSWGGGGPNGSPDNSSNDNSSSDNSNGSI